MKKSRVLAYLFGFCLILLVGGVVGLAIAPLAPHTQTVEQAIPNDQIPR